MHEHSERPSFSEIPSMSQSPSAASETSETSEREGSASLSSLSFRNDLKKEPEGCDINGPAEPSHDDVSNEENNELELNRTLTSYFQVQDAMRMQINEAATEKLKPQEVINNTSAENVLKKVFTDSSGEIKLPPDGGYGWIVTLCVFLVMFSTWGCNAGFGVFLAFYLKNNTFAGANRFDYATIAGLTVGCGQGFAPLVTVCYRVIGCKNTMLIGTAFMFAGYLMASFSVSLWELYLTQGLLIGLSISFCFVPATVVLPDWFLRKRAYAIGLSYMGTGCGGVTYGLAVNKMITDSQSTRWALRVLCISCTCTMLVSIALIRQRNPLPITGIKRWGPIWEQFKIVFDTKIIKNPTCLIIAVWFGMALFGYMLMVYTLSAYAQSKGLSAYDGSTMTAIANGAQAIGRPIMGMMGDKFGRINTTVVLSSAMTIFLFGFWIPAHTFVQLIFFSICMGSTVGVAQVMVTVLIADLVGREMFLPAWAFVNSVPAPYLLCCEIIAQALVTNNRSNPYLHTQCFSGACFAFALIVILILRERSVSRKLKETVDERVRRIDDKNDEKVCSDLKSRIYRSLLGNSPSKYIKRLLYPMKV